MVTSLRKTTDILFYAIENFPNQLICGVLEGKITQHTYKQLYDEAITCAKALIKIGIHKNENVGIVTSNRIEWCVLDAAIAMIGAVNVTLFPNYDKKDFVHIINDAQIRHLFIGNKLILQFIKPIIKDVPSLEHIYSFDFIDEAIHFKELLNDLQLSSFDVELESRLSEVNGDDTYTIFYTSGTGGTPKGVIMPHQSMVNACIIMGGYLNLNYSDVAISFLSCSHAYERGHYFAYMYYGVRLHYAEMIKSPIENVKKYQPTVFTSVPLLLQKIQESVISHTANEPEQKVALDYSYNYNFGDEIQNRSFINYSEKFYKVWKSVLGNNIRVISCAGAPLPDYLFRFICSIGVKLQEIYGLSECFAVTCGRYPDKVKFGTVGAIGDFVDVKISDEGEIIVKSVCMMKGFYNLPEYTKEVLDSEGWFKTGDKGEIIDNEYLKITGRKKDLFKISSGMYIAPTEIEGIINVSPYIINSLVFERNGKVAVLVVPNTNEILKNNKFSDSFYNESLIKEFIFEEISKLYNENALVSEQISEVFLDHSMWTVDGGELTPTMKIKRNFITQSRCLT
jgi:long-chain acyl-CoA synthetase